MTKNANFITSKPQFEYRVEEDTRSEKIHKSVYRYYYDGGGGVSEILFNTKRLADSKK